MNLAKLTHPRHVLKDALDARIQREEAHLARLKARALARAEERAAAAAAGQPPPPQAGPQ